LTLARSLILHLHAKSETSFHEALLPINIFIEHYYLGKRERMREKEWNDIIRKQHDDESFIFRLHSTYTEKIYIIFTDSSIIPSERLTHGPRPLISKTSVE
jgi:hypothetical protein